MYISKVLSLFEILFCTFLIQVELFLTLLRLGIENKETLNFYRFGKVYERCFGILRTIVFIVGTKKKNIDTSSLSLSKYRNVYIIKKKLDMKDGGRTENVRN